jgi:hypothetical protein
MSDEPDPRQPDAPTGDTTPRATVSDADVRDELPAELDVTALDSEYLFPNNSRRRIPGYLYVVLGALCVLLWAARRDHQPILSNRGFLFAGIGLVLFGLYHLQAGWNLAVDEREALVAATRKVGFPVGHASAQLGWRGVRSRPTWRILLYSNEPTPLKRGLVMVDGIDAEIVSSYIEDNPEDWTELDKA